jgi:hypothetical protein
MRGWSGAALALLMAACAAPPAHPGSGPASGAPQISVGDFGTIHIQTDYPAPDGTQRVAARETLALGGGSLDVLKLEYDDGAEGDHRRHTSWYTADTHALVRTSWSDSHSRRDVTYDPPCLDYQWPLQVGHEVTFECPWKAVGTSPKGPFSNEGVTRKRYLVEAFENVTVPAGTFEAYRIATWDSENMNGEVFGDDEWQARKWYAPAACAEVKSTEYTIFGTGGTTLLAFRCQSPGQAT